MPRKLFGLGSGTPSRFPYEDRPQSGPGVAPSTAGNRFRVIIIFGPGGAISGLFVYSGDPALGNPPIAYIAAAGVTKDPFGNTLPDSTGGVVSSNNLAHLFAALIGGAVEFGNSADPLSGPSSIIETGGGSFGASLTIESGQGSSATISGNLFLQDDQSAGTPGIGQVSVVNAAFRVSAASSGAGQLVFVKQTGTDNAMTIFLNVGSGGGAAQAALNVVSDNPNFSAAEIRGTEENRGTVKITHDGYADGSDANAAGLSIDMQTTQGGATGTSARGIFITSTTDSPMGGDAIAVFVGVPVPSLKFQVNGSGNLVARANAFFANPVIIGSTSSDAGGSGSGLTLCHTTDPTSNPAAGHVILFTDAAGNLKARGSAGTITTIATP
jgi:hypothetical protein